MDVGRDRARRRGVDTPWRPRRGMQVFRECRTLEGRTLRCVDNNVVRYDSPRRDVDVHRDATHPMRENLRIWDACASRTTRDRFETTTLCLVDDSRCGVTFR